MTIFPENFDHLHFTGCCFHLPIVEENLIGITVERGLTLLRSHPAFPVYGGQCPRALLRWSFPREYSIKMIPYLGDPKSGDGFGPPRTETHWFSRKLEGARPYELEGITLENPSWCDISIYAESFELIIL